MRTKYDLIIGIDPDTEKSGVAIMSVQAHAFQLRSLALPELLDTVTSLIDDFEQPEEPLSLNKGTKAAVIVEIDREHLHNWHLAKRDTRNSAASKGFDQGRCFQTAAVISELLRSRGITVIEKAPLIKCWSGKDRKITHDEIFRLKDIHIITAGKTNQEQRDALLLALDISELPIILLPKKNR